MILEVLEKMAHMANQEKEDHGETQDLQVPLVTQAQLEILECQVHLVAGDRMVVMEGQVREDIMVRLGHLVKMDSLDSLEPKVLQEHQVILVAMVDRGHLVMMDPLERRGLLAKEEEEANLEE